MTPSQLEQIRKFAEEVAAREGCELYDLEYREGPGRILRVFIDKSSGGGVGIEDCVNVSRGLNLRLDVEDAVPGGHYDLEVSSPGLDRKLTQLWHFERAIGQTVQVRFRTSTGEAKTFEGRMVAVEGSTLRFENAKGPFEVIFQDVQKARIVLLDVMPKKPGKPGQKKR